MAKKEKKFKLFTKGSSDYALFIITMLLVALGIIMVLSASAPDSVSEVGHSYKYLNKQLKSAILGIIAMFAVSKIDYKIYRKLKWIIYIVVVILLLLVIPFGRSEKGATRWIYIFGFNFQPSELAKIGLIVFFASFLADIKEKGKIKDIRYGCWLPLAMLVPIIGIIFGIQNHFSATFLICAITAVQMFIAGTRISHFIITGLVALPVAYGGYHFYKEYKNAGVEGAVKQESFRSTRIKTWLDPFSDPKGEGWQTIQSFYAIASGGLFGLGLGQGKQKYLYLPEPHNDFIFSVLAEELGFFGCILVILLFILFIWRGIIIAMRAQDNFGCLLAIGIVTMLGLQAIINLAVVVGLIPVTGVTLPFFSYGGTALMVNLASVGLLLNVSRSGNK